ncbi:MAG: DEAD/DEAH box helicase [Saprospiraceae bacterium]|nr:DEAD/DEAH box helicase [Saprospiraceae bacterium]
MSSFGDLGLTSGILKSIAKIGFETPTPIQEEAIPKLLTGNQDLIGLAQTGTGKTAAYGLPMIDLTNSRIKHLQGLVLCPTRELCLQIHKELKIFSEHRPGLHIIPVYGGADIRKQIREIRSGVHIVIATPGRLLDLMKRKVIDLTELDRVVLDEADEMLNMGFQEDIDKILETTPEERNTWLFSATMPKAVERIAKRYLKNPMELSAGSRNIANRDISHHYIITRKADHVNLLKLFLDANTDLFGLVFCRTRRDTRDVAEKLAAAGYNAEALHGELNQRQRDRVMNKFRKRNLQVLVATDVAARGIDVIDITHVFNLNIPDDLAFYTHRSGRTARAGKKGQSVVFVSTRDLGKLRRLEKIIQAKFSELEKPDASHVLNNQLGLFLERWLTTPIHPKIEQYAQELESPLKGITKQELLGRLLSLRFEKILASTSFEKKERKPKKKAFDASSYPKSQQRMFINIGSMDMKSKKDLIYFITSVAEISKDAIMGVEFNKRQSYFFVNKRLGKKLTQAMEGVNYQGRNIRVNPDGGIDFSDGERPKKKSKSKLKARGSKGRNRPKKKRR